MKGSGIVAKTLMVVIVFPTLLVVVGGVFRLLALIVENSVSPDASWRESLVAALLYAGLLVGAVVSYLLCRKMWARAVGQPEGSDSGGTA